MMDEDIKVGFVELKQNYKQLHTDLVELKTDVKNFINAQNEVNTTLRTQIAVLQIKAGAWGGLAGLIIILGAILMKALSGP